MNPGPFSRDLWQSMRDPLGPRAGTAGGWSALLLLASFVAFQDLAGRSLHSIDTARWGTLAREMIRSGEWLVPTRYGEVYANKPVLYLWFVAGPAALHGAVTPFLTRLPSALGLVLLALSTAWWARIRTGSAVLGRIAALLALSSFYLVWLGREGRLDMMSAGLATAAAACLDRAAMGGRRASWGAGVFLGAALLTKGPPLLLVPLAVLLIPSPGRGTRARLRAARPHIIFGVGVGLALLWFIPALLYGGSAYADKLLVRQATERLSGKGNHLEGWWYYLAFLPGVMAPWGLGYLAVMGAALRRRWRRTLGAAGGLALAGAVVIGIFSVVPTKHHRYLAPVIPPLAIALAAWIHAWIGGAVRPGWGKRLRHIGLIGLVSSLAALVAAGFSLYPVWGVIPPALLLLGTGVLALRGPPGDPGTGPGAERASRRHAVGCALLLVVGVIAVTCVLRYRFRLRDNELFNRNLAVLVSGREPVYTAGGVTPENLFLGAPEARMTRTVAELPPADSPVPHVVVCLASTLDAVRRHYGRPGTILIPSTSGEAWTAVRFTP